MENFDRIENLASQVVSSYQDERTSKDRMLAFFDLIPDLLCIAKRDGFFEWVNKAWEKNLGWTFDEMLSRPWLEFVHPDDRDATIEAASQMNEGNLDKFSNRYLTKAGDYRRLSWITLRWNGGGRAHCIAKLTD